MKFVAVEDVAAPLDMVWAAVTDFDSFERRVTSRAADLRRTPAGPVAKGTSWGGKASFQGKVRKFSVEMADLVDMERLLLDGGTDGMAITFEVALEARGQASTRMTVTTEAKAKTLSARLLLQSARLARSTMAKRYKKRIAGFAERIEAGA